MFIIESTLVNVRQYGFKTARFLFEDGQVSLMVVSDADVTKTHCWLTLFLIITVYNGSNRALTLCVRDDRVEGRRGRERREDLARRAPHLCYRPL